ncbi:MAG: hypothetical protein ABSF53_02245 [Terracidiphilus sp.]
MSTFLLPLATAFGHAWKAAAADLYVNGEPIWDAFQVGMTATPSGLVNGVTLIRIDQF